jgi:hypothetical protein
MNTGCLTLAVCESCCNHYGLFAIGRNEKDAGEKLWNLAKDSIIHFWAPGHPDMPKNQQQFEEYYGVTYRTFDQTKPESLSGGWNG